MKAGEKFLVSEDFTDADCVEVKAGQEVRYDWSAADSLYGKGCVIATIKGSGGEQIAIPKRLLKPSTERGNPEASPTGSLRFNSGKVQTREIDPAFILGIGEVLTKSRQKYDHFNWCRPTKLSTPYESLMRHLLAFQGGEDIDAETQSHHLLHAATNLMFMYYHCLNNPEESDDRFFKKDKK